MKKITILISFFLISFSLLAQEEVKIKDGKTVIIYNNGTWKYKMRLPTNNSFTDPRDGQTYKTITIGTQVWMAENLKATKYRNGTPMPNITVGYRNGEPVPIVNDRGEVIDKLTGGFFNVPNKIGTIDILYNWYAVNDNRKLAPLGWHVPTDAEWTTLTNYLGGEDIAGGKLKETGTNYWANPNTGATNESGFSALPVSSFQSGENGGYTGGDTDGIWWTSTEYSTNKAWIRRVVSSQIFVHRANYGSKDNGHPVRCIKDTPNNIIKKKP